MLFHTTPSLGPACSPAVMRGWPLRPTHHPCTATTQRLHDTRKSQETPSWACKLCVNLHLAAFCRAFRAEALTCHQCARISHAAATCPASFERSQGPIVCKHHGFE